ncbi:MAG: glutamine-synthetase adenylyltransferase, partial [Pseudomonadota bacterium]
MMSLSDIQLPIYLDPDPRSAIEKASIYAPYLARLAEREVAFLASLDNGTLSSAFEHLLSSLVDDLAALDGDAQIMSRLRLAKRQAHLLIASADLSGCWPLLAVTKAMTRFAETSAACALQAAARLRNVPTDGLFLVALGKMGAYELNYSSDIDIA